MENWSRWRAGGEAGWGDGGSGCVPKGGLVHWRPPGYLGSGVVDGSESEHEPGPGTWTTASSSHTHTLHSALALADPP